MDYFFQRYLLSKQTVDDRALNKDVLQALRAHLPPQPVSVIEVGAGIGTMLKRLVEWDILVTGDYVLVDEQPENLAYAREWIPQWATEAGLSVERIGANQIHLCDQSRGIRIHLKCVDVFDFIHRNKTPADVLIAHAFLDLLPIPGSLDGLFSITKGLAWLTINFDGISTLQPEIERNLDEQIEQLYHASMDTRLTGGDSRTGRKLFEHFRRENIEVLAAGASDWVVHANDRCYPADEKYFLQYILHCFESSLKDCDQLDPAAFRHWLTERYKQIENGDLVYIAHQMDFLARKKM
jgi:SAM-dependent methyltransferase